MTDDTLGACFECSLHLKAFIHNQKVIFLYIANAPCDFSVIITYCDILFY